MTGLVVFVDVCAVVFVAGLVVAVAGDLRERYPTGRRARPVRSRDS